MEKYFKVAQFVCACIIFLCSGTGFMFNIKNVINSPDGILIICVWAFVICMCLLLTREAYKEMIE